MWIDDELKLAGLLFGIAFVIIAGLMYMVYRFDKEACYTRYARFEPEYVGVVTGCMITVDEQRVPAESLRMTL